MEATYTRDDLIGICERAIVPQGQWSNRDSSHSIEGVGRLWALLKAGCDFSVLREGKLSTDERTIWIEVHWPGFMTFDVGSGHDTDTFYLPTPERLETTKGRDWY